MKEISVEIERKFLVEKNALPANLEEFPCQIIEQGYICTDPVIRIRRTDDHYTLTVKSSGLLAREEFELPLSGDSYARLLPKTEGILIRKKRYRIPEEGGLTIELDVFEGEYEGLYLAEVEFSSKEAAFAYEPQPWMGKDVTENGRYQNSRLSRGVPELMKSR